MKKLFASVLVGALLLMGTQAYAQLSVGAGYLNSTTTTNNDSKEGMNGFYVGGNYNIPVVAGLGVAPGLYGTFSFGSRSVSESAAGVTVSGKAAGSEIDINVPVNLNYKFNLGRDLNLVVYAGPIFQYAISSKVKYSYNTNSGVGQAVLDELVKNGVLPSQSDNFAGDDYNRFNVYLGGGVGIDVAGIQVLLGYDHTLTNMCKISNTTMGRSHIRIGVGYSF